MPHPGGPTSRQRQSISIVHPTLERCYTMIMPMSPYADASDAFASASLFLSLMAMWPGTCFNPSAISLGAMVASSAPPQAPLPQSPP